MDLQRRHRYLRVVVASGILAVGLLAAPHGAGALLSTEPSLPGGPTGPVAAPTLPAPTPVLPAPSVPVKPPPAPKIVTPPPVTTPTVKTPTVKTPTVTTPTVKTPTVTTPTVKTPTVKSPSVAGGSPTAGSTTGSGSLPLIGGSSGGGLIGGGSGGGGTIVGGLIGGGGGGTLAGGGSIVGGTPGGPLGGGTLGGPGSGSGASPLGGGPSGFTGAGGFGGPAGSGGQFNPLVALLAAEDFAGASVNSREFAALLAAVSQLQACIGALAPLEQQVLVTRFGLGGGRPRSVGGVSRALGISRGGAIRVERRALVKLRALAQTGCGGGAGATSSLAYVLDPTTVGGLVSAAGPGSGGLSIFGGPARAAAMTPPLWGSDPSDGLRSLLVILALAGGLLLLAGATLRMLQRHEEVEAPAAPSRVLERPARPIAPMPATARHRTAERRFDREHSNGRVKARRPGDRTGAR
jgi:sigma-70-like protein